jgi:hypothetical protein
LGIIACAIKEEVKKRGGQIYMPCQEIHQEDPKRRENGRERIPHETFDVYPVSHPVCPKPTVHFTLPIMTTINPSPPSTLTMA